MLKALITLFLFIFIFSQQAFSFEKRKSIAFSNSPEENIDTTRWRPFNQSSLIVTNVYYRFRVNKKHLNSGNGPGFEFGVNLAYLFNQKMLIAPYFGIGMRDIFWNTEHSAAYLNDYDANFNGSALHGNDSAVVFHARNLMRDGQMFHDRIGYYGLMIRLPYINSPVIKVYTGEYSSAVKTIETTINLEPLVSSDKKTDNDYWDLTRKLSFGVEVIVFNGRSRVRNYGPDFIFLPESKRKNWLTQYGCVSVYFEKIKSTSTRYQFSDGYHNVDVPMNSFMSESFMHKYRNEFNLGIKVSCALY